MQNKETKLLESMNMGYTLKYEFSFDSETPSNNVIKNMHFQIYKKLRANWRAKLKAQLLDLDNIAPIEFAFLYVERHCAGGGLDWDNAYGGLKPVLDCLVLQSKRNPDGLGLITDDNPKNMPLPPFFVQSKAKKGMGKTILKIYELSLNQ